MAFSEKEIEKLKKDVSEIYTKVAEFLLGLLGPNPKISVEAVTFGLLRVAALLATNTQCRKETFLKLATIAYDDEKPGERVQVPLKEASKKILN